jgi:hypothetical protein
MWTDNGFCVGVDRCVTPSKANRLADKELQATMELEPGHLKVRHLFQIVRLRCFCACNLYFHLPASSATRCSQLFEYNIIWG